MLVFALQFSRCARHDVEAKDGISGSPEAPASACHTSQQRRPAIAGWPRAGRGGKLPQNGREDKSGRAAHGQEVNLRLSMGRATAPIVHQLGVSRAGVPQRAHPDEMTLLRKEVIQPHLPVRLPCYDFTPITDPTFDGSFPKGLGHRLRVLPTFVV